MTQPKQVVYTPIDIDDADFIDTPRDPYQEYEDEEFDKFKAEMHDSQDDAKITVGKKLTDARGQPMGKKTFECFECGIDDYTFSQLCTRIREDFGTGLYLIQGRDSGGKFKFKKVVGIQAPVDPNATSNDGTPASLIASMSHAMVEQQDRFERLMINSPQTQVDPIDQMTKMMSAMGAMMGAMGINQNPPPPQLTFLERMTEMKMTKDLMGDIMGSSEGSGQVDNFWGAIAKAAESFGAPLMQAIAMAQTTGEINADGVLQTKALPAPKPEATFDDAKIKEEKPAEADNMNLKQMKEQLEFLLIQAKNKVDHKIVVYFIIEQMPDEDSAYDALEAFLQDENCIDRCAMIEPEVNQYREWFLDWRQAMLAKLSEMIENTIESAQPDSGAGDALELVKDASDDQAGDTGDPDGDTGRVGGDLPDANNNVANREAVQEKSGDTGTGA